MSRFLKRLFPFVTKKKYQGDVIACQEAITECVKQEHLLIEELLETVDIHEQNQLSSFSLGQSILKIIYRRLEEKHD
tara:strand:- start:15277 stop:15507 length:231 start_codon:yes stop_codon:yes gene_type:complete